MIRMVQVNKQSVAFCKYTIAGLLWLALLFRSIIPVYIVFIIMFISAFTGVHRAPLVKLFDWTIAKKIGINEEYINMHSMRFAHIVGCVFSALSIITYYFCPVLVPAILTTVLAILQTIAAFGYCSAQKLYECVICNSNCCRFGKKIRSIKKNAR
ncbi:DUF4395 family protein [Paludicola sp. MB14-C6]|uniref:DUF4395 family protein n=1 Tax=Paludihabitans sp. MB14-C6 TaxID=3070656 RepID=UPI0027DE4BC2|nr:DUF4395 family protein [Paludicola sp. MB14-C6]WMJ24030.1 DUF4395 family protein [Paludicola sp. MB14-C6]